MHGRAGWRPPAPSAVMMIPRPRPSAGVAISTLLSIVLLTGSQQTSSTRLGGCHYTSQCLAGPCGPSSLGCEDTPVGAVCPAQECARPFGLDAPRFHVRGTSCGLNDPNGPWWDPIHGFYHLFWQSHETMVHNASSGNGTICGGPVWGHAVSSNLSHWAHLPVALWNDHWFDLHAVYSGSTTLVGSLPVIIYPGICDKTHPGCPQSWGVALAAAVPANESDPCVRQLQLPLIHTHWR
jgi:hypothetical protein